MQDVLINSTELNIACVVDLVSRAVMKVVDEDNNDALKLMDKTILEQTIEDIAVNRIKDNIKL